MDRGSDHASERPDLVAPRERGSLDQALPGEGAALSRPGTIVPLYVDPGQGDAWTALVAAKALHPAVPVIAIANPQNGPGAASRLAYVAGISSLVAVGVVVIGYVRTNFGQRDAAEVRQEIERWSDWYRPAGLAGIFLDQQATTAGLES